VLSTVHSASSAFSDTRESLLARCADAFALEQHSPVESIEALTLAVGEAVVIDVRDFALSSRLFRTAITAESLMHDLVQIATATGQQHLAITHLQRLRDRMPEHLEIRTGLADLQIASGHVSEGVKELRHIAERYEHAGNIDRMVDAMRRISNAVPANAEIKAMLIDAYVHRGVPDEARRELHLLGDLYQKRGKHAEAARAYRRGAEIAATTGQHRDASALFEKAVDAEPGDVSYRHAAVAFHIMNGAVDKATPHLREIVRLAIDRDDPDEAVAALHQIIGLAPNDAAAYHRLGEVLTSLGEYAQAERVYRRLATIVPEDPVLLAKQSALAALAAG
jgi:tetratricopeptide (TPR) repeat protein